jgi:formylglycine-generating enzyme required for sulfatase activity
MSGVSEALELGRARTGVRSRGRLACLAAALALAAGCGGSAPTASSVASSAAAAPSAGQIRTDTRGVEQVWVPAGSFMMGTDAASIAQLTALGPPGFVLGELVTEQPQHRVRLTHGYWIDRYEVTNASFKAFLESGDYRVRSFWSADGWAWLSTQPEAGRLSCFGDAPDLPARCVTWYEAEAYARWRGGRLPTEAEWEYAARGPDSSTYPWGNDWDASRCNVIDSAGPTRVGSYPSGVSWAGAQDMAGNAMEWVADWLGEDYYATSPADDPTGPATGTRKVEKGGWWGSNQFVARAAYRHFEDAPDYGDLHIGFRVATS